MRNILIAVDGSRCSLREADYVGEQYAGIHDARITLFHVLTSMPPSFWDDGHILDEEESAARKKIVDKWVASQTRQLEPFFREAEELLVEHGIGRDQIRVKTVADSDDVAGSILEEALSGGYQTLVLGRCGHSAVEHLFLGNVASKVLHQGTGIAICVV